MAEEHLVLPARRLALDAVREHDLPSAAARDRAELQHRREAGAAAAAQLASFDGLEQRGAVEPPRQRPVQVQMLAERHRTPVRVQPAQEAGDGRAHAAGPPLESCTRSVPPTEPEEGSICRSRSRRRCLPSASRTTAVMCVPSSATTGPRYAAEAPAVA